MNTLTKLILAAALAAAALVPVGVASAGPPKVEFTRYKVEVTGIVIDDWHYQSRGWGTGEGGARGAGTETIGFSTRRPVRFLGVVQSGSVRGFKLGNFSIAPLGRLQPLRGSIVRTGSYRTDDGMPVCEGGPQYCPDEGPGPQPSFQCPRLKRKLPYRLGADTDAEETVKLRLEIDLPSRPYADCHPDHDHGSNTLLADSPIDWYWYANALKYLERGERDTYRVDRELFLNGDSEPKRRCPKSWDSGVGFKQCVVYDYTVEIRRIR
jgi:hypothetical protein